MNMYRSLSNLIVPLPEDVIKLKMYGDFDGALKLISHMLTKDIPKALRERLEIEKDIIRVIGIDEYPYTFEQASEIMANELKDYKEEELTELKEIGAADWIYINGKVHFQRRFFENLTKTRPAIAKRVKIQSEDSEAEKKNDLLNNNIRLMKNNGKRTVKIQLRSILKAKKEFERVGKKVKVHLPIPTNAQQVSEFKILKTSPEAKIIAPEDSEQRTIYFETELQADQEFSVEYSFVNHVDYVELNPAKASLKQPNFCTEEMAPHIMFTPYLKELLAEIIGEETNPVIKARRIYDFITTKVMYSFVREYFTLENISEYAAINLKGDCGVQAILFITLCRMAGIPAKWQSGLYVTELYTGCHDWAQFYVEPYGWVFADLSFGGSAYRANEMDRWNYYFGNLDVFRMPANSEIQTDFIPPKEYLRADPIDNQRGEFEYEDQGLLYSQLEEKQILINMEDI